MWCFLNKAAFLYLHPLLLPTVPGKEPARFWAFLQWEMPMHVQRGTCYKCIHAYQGTGKNDFPILCVSNSLWVSNVWGTNEWRLGWNNLSVCQAEVATTETFLSCHLSSSFHKMAWGQLGPPGIRLKNYGEKQLCQKSIIWRWSTHTGYLLQYQKEGGILFTVYTCEPIPTGMLPTETRLVSNCGRRKHTLEPVLHSYFKSQQKDLWRNRKYSQNILQAISAETSRTDIPWKALCCMHTHTYDLARYQEVLLVYVEGNTFRNPQSASSMAFS